jgi:hypothetical protein
MAQLRRISRQLSQLNPFVANAAQPVSNPISRGFDPTMRVDFVRIQLSLEIGGGVLPGTVSIQNRAELDSILDGAMSNIRFFSGTCGEMIRNLNLSDLYRLVEFTTGEHLSYTGINGIGTQTVTNAAGNVDVQLELRVPFNLIKHTSFRAAHAPRVMQMSDGGFGYTAGTGTCTLGGVAATPFNVANCNIQIFLEGPTNAGVSKSSPLLYESQVFNAQQGLEFPSGLYYTLLQSTTSALAAWGPTAGGLAAAWRIFLDGVETTSMNDSDPMGAVKAAMDGLGGSDSWRVSSGYDVAGVGGESTFDVPGVPIAFTSYTDRSRDIECVAGSRLVVDMGTAYPAAQTFLACRVIPVSQVPDVAECPCNGNPQAIPQGMPGEGGGTSSAVKPFAPVTIK